MKTAKYFLFSEDNREIIKKIKSHTDRLSSEVLSKEQKEEITYTVQNLQNELNLRLVSHSTWIVKVLSLITIILTAFTILLSVFTVWSDIQSQSSLQKFQKKEIHLLENIVIELKEKK